MTLNVYTHSYHGLLGHYLSRYQQIKSLCSALRTAAVELKTCKFLVRLCAHVTGRCIIRFTQGPCKRGFIVDHYMNTLRLIRLFTIILKKHPCKLGHCQFCYRMAVTGSLLECHATYLLLNCMIVRLNPDFCVVFLIYIFKWKCP
uniref:Uncharacterized protein n=1 Tax=Salarias fasciatus TaxID=181472 RepID=A0A672IHP3_SALFA